MSHLIFELHSFCLDDLQKTASAWYMYQLDLFILNCIIALQNSSFVQKTLQIMWAMKTRAVFRNIPAPKNVAKCVYKAFINFRFFVNWTYSCYGMEMNVEKTKVMRISRQPSPVTITIDQNNWRMWNVLNIWVVC